MSEKTCASCGRVFDSGAFGTGWKYCSVLCRQTQGYRYAPNRVGRPRRFPLVTTNAEITLLHSFFRSHGWNLADTGWEGVYKLANGWNAVYVCFGGGARERKAQTCAYIQDDKVLLKSTCVRARRVLKPPEVPTTRVIRGPCKRIKCKRCNYTRWLRAAVALAEKDKLMDTQNEEAATSATL